MNFDYIDNYFVKEPRKTAAKIFAENLRTRRVELGYTQTELGQKCGLHRNFISSIENHKRTPSLRSVKKVCSALQIDIPIMLSDGYTPAKHGVCCIDDGVYTYIPIDSRQLTPKIRQLLEEIDALDDAERNATLSKPGSSSGLSTVNNN